ncbi:hypothetical protein AALP_AAs40498U000200 [Arabis alpina]|uniref:Zinc knuckle CX2CX4HX4C domain-containing protein n=1 Tax=Arabis alpina TaxID=50452 RepID=A0A087G307_ARAAL|nr:hypothetical protein AALP_AAs40498U000200 [Arabis alpina]
MESIGEALGEFLEVDDSEPIPRVRVMLDCDSPLIMRRELDDAGQICVLHLQYEKLHIYCSGCSQVTHEAPLCPERVRDQHHHREQQLEQYQKRELEEKQGNQRSNREDRGKAVVSRKLPQEPKRRGHDAMASSSRPKPVRRALLSELETSGVNYTDAKPSTKEWVCKAFVETSRDTVKKNRSVDRLSPQQETKRAKPRALWYRATEEEAAMANEMDFQQAKWAEANRSQASEKQKIVSDGISNESGLVARVSIVGVEQDEMGRGLVTGPETLEAQQADNFDVIELNQEFQVMGFTNILNPTEIISPLKGLVNKAHKSRRTTQQINKVGVKKKIEHNPFQGKRIHNNMALAILEPPNVLADVSIPSTSNTGPDEGETSKELENPVGDEN